MASPPSASGKVSVFVSAANAPVFIAYRTDASAGVSEAGVENFSPRWRLEKIEFSAGSVVSDQKPPIWKAYRQIMVPGIFLLLTQGVIIVALLWRQAKRKNIRAELVRSNDRLHLAMETGKTVGWECDLANGTAFLFGDLQTIFGIPSDAFTIKLEDFYGYVHPDDRQRVQDALADARHDRKPYVQEFRLVWPEGGILRWVACRGKFEYAQSGKSTRMFGLAVDITERKMTEEALRKSEEKFSKAFRESPLALTLTSAVDHRYIDVNDTFQKITGWTSDEVIGRTPFDIGIWADSTQRTEFVKRLLAEEHIREYEVVFRTKDGQERTGLGTVELIEIEGEQCALSVIADITEVKRAREQSEMSERRFRQFFETVPEYCYILSADGNILDANRAACDALGLTKDEILSKPLSTIYAPESSSKLLELLEKWNRTGALRNEEMFILTKDGQKRPVLLNAGSVLDGEGNVLFATSVQTDITDVRAVQERLRGHQLRLDAIVDSAMDAIIAVDESQRIMVFNPAAEKMFRCPVKDAIGNTLDQFIPEKYRGRHRSHISQFIGTGITSRRMGETSSLSALRTNGEEFPIEASLSSADVAGQRLFTVIIREITERKRAEEALASVSRKLIEAHEEERAWLARELHDDYNQRIALLTASLTQLKQSLPVSAVEASHRVDELCDQAMSLGLDVQALSHRLHSSKLEYLGLKTAAAGLCREFSDQHGVKIDFHSDEIPKDLPKETSLCLFRVLQEALQNAMKHSGSEHFRVTIAASPNDISLSVADSGRGFNLEAAVKGRGVGITNMKERMKLIGGELTVESQPGGGTVVRARAPLPAETRAAGAAT